MKRTTLALALFYSLSPTFSCISQESSPNQESQVALAPGLQAPEEMNQEQPTVESSEIAESANESTPSAEQAQPTDENMQKPADMEQMNAETATTVEQQPVMAQMQPEAPAAEMEQPVIPEQTQEQKVETADLTTTPTQDAASAATPEKSDEEMQKEFEAFMQELTSMMEDLEKNSAASGTTPAPEETEAAPAAETPAAEVTPAPEVAEATQETTNQ